MPLYKYKAIELSGRSVNGTLFARDEAQLVQQLQARSLFCTDMHVEDSEPQGRLGSLKLSPRELSIFSRQLSVILNAGITIANSLHVMYDRAVKAKHKRIYLELYENVQKGKTLSEAMRESICVFPQMFINMIEAGEASGTIVECMSRMSGHYEKEYKLRNTIRSAMVYPIVLLVMSLLVVILLMTFVLPKFFDLFEGASVPALTSALMAFSKSMTTYWYIYLGALLLIVLAVRLLPLNQSYRLWRDRMRLRLPIFGKYFRVVYTSRCSRAIASLYSSGIPIVRALEIAGRVIGNSFVSRKFEAIIASVKEGNTLASSFEASALFDPMFYSMLSVGEISGAIDEVLEKTASYFDEETETATKKLMSALEPCLIGFIAAIVCLILAAIYPAIYGMYDSIV